MNKSELTTMVHLYENALNTIVYAFMIPEELLDCDDGLSSYERLEMSYENIKQVAAQALLEGKVIRDGMY